MNGRVLGIALNMSSSGHLAISRGSEIPDAVDTVLTKRGLFSLCGRLTSHYPVAEDIL